MKKLKNVKHVLMILLRKEFMNDLTDAKLCPSDIVGKVLKNSVILDEYFDMWLVKKGYVE